MSDGNYKGGYEQINKLFQKSKRIADNTRIRSLVDITDIHSSSDHMVIRWFTTAFEVLAAITFEL